MALLSSETRVLTDFRSWLRDRFGERLCELTLFGSRARGEGNEDSDLDVLVVVDALTPAEGREVAEHCGDYLTNDDLLVSALAVSRAYIEQLRARERLLAAEIARDGISLFEPWPASP